MSVKPAYAENMLIRAGLGEVATAETLAQIEADEAAAAAAAAAALAAAKVNAEKLASAFDEPGLEVAKKVGPDGSIFGSVTSAELAEAIAKHAGVTVDKKAITPPDLKRLGEGTAEVSLHKQVKAKVKVVVVEAGLSAYSKV